MRKPVTLILSAFVLLFCNLAYSQTTQTVQVSNYQFTPSSLTITQGDTVKWVWVNGMHTTTSDSTSGIDVWDAPIDQNHQSFSFVFSSPGVHSYYCRFHVSLGMRGTITVQPLTSVTKLEQLPSNYILDQNYPNPFNPATTIKYALPMESKVKLILYNSIGQVVRVLTNKIEPAGYHEINLNSGNMASGVYFYLLSAESSDGKRIYNSVKKLILLK